MSDTHSNSNSNFDDGMTDAERHYLSSGGDVTDALLSENKGLPAAPSEPAPEPPAPAPGAPAADGQQQPPAAAAPPAAPGPEEDPGDEPSPVPGKPPRRVSWNKYQAETEARATLERQLQEQAVRNARVEERLSLLSQALQPAPGEQQQQKPPKPRPDPNQDIFGYAQWLEENLQDMTGRLEEVYGKVDGYEKQIQTGQAEMDQERNYFDALNQYAGREPHFVPAYNFLLRNRAAELMAPRYPRATYEQLMQAEIPQDIAQMLQQEERDLYKTAFQNKRSPADDIFRMAQLRGYRPPAPQAQPVPTNGSAHPTNGAAPPAAQQRPGVPLAAAPANGAVPANGATPPVPGNGAAPTAVQLVEQIKRGQGAAFSLSNASGGTGIELTPQVLADMPQDQFEALFNELQASGNKEKLMQLMGQ